MSEKRISIDVQDTLIIDLTQEKQIISSFSLQIKDITYIRGKSPIVNYEVLVYDEKLNLKESFNSSIS